MELYIHIPFCVRKCEYCPFVSFPEKSAKKDEYIDLLLRESRERKEEFTEPVTTVYIGGGTPSLLSAGQLHGISVRLFFLGCPGASAEYAWKNPYFQGCTVICLPCKKAQDTEHQP